MKNRNLFDNKENINLITEEVMKRYQDTRLKKSVEVDKRIMDIFLSIGISAHLQGYHYLRESIKLIMEHPDYISSITKIMYPKIADKFETTPCRVERAIRHALEVSYNKGKMIRLNDVLGLRVLNRDERPTNSEFVALIADKLNLEIK